MLMEIIRTNIAKVEADAIVLPAKPELKEGPGASEAIFKAAGRDRLARACAKHGRVEVGHVVPTEAFDLDADFIIHAVVPKWIDGNHSENELLCATYLASLQAADQLKCQTIAFPVLAAGNMGFNRELAFEIARRSIEEFEGENLQKAILVVFGNRMTSIAKARGFSFDENLVEVERAKAHNKRHSKNVTVAIFDYLKKPQNREKLFEKAMAIIAASTALVESINRMKSKDD